jgi:hypothetical protein
VVFPKSCFHHQVACDDDDSRFPTMGFIEESLKSVGRMDDDDDTTSLLLSIVAFVACMVGSCYLASNTHGWALDPGIQGMACNDQG